MWGQAQNAEKIKGNFYTFILQDCYIIRVHLNHIGFCCYCYCLLVCLLFCLFTCPFVLFCFVTRRNYRFKGKASISYIYGFFSPEIGEPTRLEHIWQYLQISLELWQCDKEPQRVTLVGYKQDQWTCSTSQLLASGLSTRHIAWITLVTSCEYQVSCNPHPPHPHQLYLGIFSFL